MREWFVFLLVTATLTMSLSEFQLQPLFVWNFSITKFSITTISIAENWKLFCAVAKSQAKPEKQTYWIHLKIKDKKQWNWIFFLLFLVYNLLDMFRFHLCWSESLSKCPPCFWTSARPFAHPSDFWWTLIGKPLQLHWDCNKTLRSGAQSCSDWSVELCLQFSGDMTIRCKCKSRCNLVRQTVHGRARKQLRNKLYWNILAIQ